MIGHALSTWLIKQRAIKALLKSDNVCWNHHCQRRIQRRCTGTEHFECKTLINFIVINMQCLQCVFYSLLSLQKHRVCVKRASKQSPDLKNYNAPGSKIPGSATDCSMGFNVCGFRGVSLAHKFMSPRTYNKVMNHLVL